MRTIMFVVALAVMSYAGCRCVCIDGENQPICDDAYELRPICPPRLCPQEPPALKPLTPPRLPPLGTETCDTKYVYDDDLGEYVWKEVCW